MESGAADKTQGIEPEGALETARINVMVADSEPLFSEALALALEEYTDLAVLEPRPGGGPGLVEAVIERRPDVVVAEYWLSGMQGPATTAAISAAVEGPRVILLAWLYGPREVAYGFAAGAAGLLPKSVGLSEVVQAVRRVAGGEQGVCPEEVQQIADHLTKKHREAAEAWQELRTLTYREFQILNLLGAGRRLTDISTRLSIQPSTAQTHIHRILEKTGTTSRHQAAALARAYGLAQP